jgi:heterodisulfide reductase subunit B
VEFASDQPLPVMYFTQLMGLAFGLDPAGYGFEQHYVDPRPALAQAGVLGGIRSP